MRLIFVVGALLALVCTLAVPELITWVTDNVAVLGIVGIGVGACVLLRFIAQGD